MTECDSPAARFHRESLAAEQDRFLDLAAVAEPDIPVPSCAPWTARDLVRHLTAIHRWAASCATASPQEPVPDDEPFVERARPEDYAAAAADLRAVLSEPDRPCRTLVGAGTVAWWVRRQLHETFIHRLDLSAALGLPPAGDELVAADCIAEVVDTMQPRQVRLARMPTIVDGIRLSTPTGSWTLGSRPVADIHGPDLAVAQLLWRRARLDDSRLTVSGDRGAAAAVLALPITP